MCIGVFYQTIVLESIENFFKELVENSDNIYVLLDKDYRIRYISSVVRRYGAEPMLLRGKSIFDFTEPDKVELWKACLTRAENKKIQEVALKLSGDAPTYFEVTAFWVKQNSAEGSQVLQLHDVTACKKKTLELSLSNQQLDQVIYKTTHDLRAPLMSAIGLLTLVEQASEEQRAEYLGLLRRSLNKLKLFIEDMNHFYRNGKMEVKKENIRWDELIEEELNDHRLTYSPERVSIEVNIHQSTAFWSDILRVKTILTNLLTNAIKYADPNKDHHNIQISVQVTCQEAVLTIKDNGIGIEKQYHGKIFDMFFRATTLSQGSGLGLFILKDTVEKLKGRISVHSEPGKGSTFTVWLPNSKPAAATVEDTRAGSRSFS